MGEPIHINIKKDIIIDHSEIINNNMELYLANGESIIIPLYKILDSEIKRRQEILNKSIDNTILKDIKETVESVNIDDNNICFNIMDKGTISIPISSLTEDNIRTELINIKSEIK